MLDGARTNGYIGWASAGDVVTLTVSVYGMKVTDQFARIVVRYVLMNFLHALSICFHIVLY